MIPVYSYVVDSTATKDETMFNSTDLVGKLWWDIDAVRLINPTQTQEIYLQSNGFNTVFLNSNRSI